MSIDFATVYNYYERLVYDEIASYYSDSGMSEDKLADVACIALNNIPPKYIRNAIDMSFFMSNEERAKTYKRVETAVADAFNKVCDQKIL